MIGAGLVARGNIVRLWGIENHQKALFSFNGPTPDEWSKNTMLDVVSGQADCRYFEKVGPRFVIWRRLRISVANYRRPMRTKYIMATVVSGYTGTGSV